MLSPARPGLACAQSSRRGHRGSLANLGFRLRRSGKEGLRAQGLGFWAVGVVSTGTRSWGCTLALRTGLQDMALPQPRHFAECPAVESFATVAEGTQLTHLWLGRTRPQSKNKCRRRRMMMAGISWGSPSFQATSNLSQMI